jgi:hypothetical protein
VLLVRREAPGGERVSEPDLSHITPDLQSLACLVTDVVKDPSNLRVHGAKSIESVRGSLAKFTQRKPIVVNRRTKVVEAGNGTLEATVANGHEHIAVVWVDDDPLTATAFAIADNRTAELSSWDAPALKLQVEALGDYEVPGVDLDWLNELDPPEPDDATAAQADEDEDADTGPQLGDMQFRLMVECGDEFKQAELLARLEEEGFTCQALMS